MPPVATNRGKYPLIVFGTAEDLTAWTSVGTPVLTGGQSDPFGGTSAVNVEDNDGAGTEYVKKTLPTTINVGTNVFVVFVRKVTEPSAQKSIIQIRDTVAAVTRVQIDITNWDTTPTVAIGTGSGSVSSMIALADGWFMLLFTADSVVPTNTNEYRLFVTDDVTTETGKLRFYLRHALLLGEPLDEAVSGSKPRAGSRFVQGADDGVEDAWITGRDHHLRGTVRWIPSLFQVTPRPSSGWDGDAEFAGVNVGFNAWLEDAQDKQTFLWVPDRTASDVSVTSFLTEPTDLADELEDDFTRSLPILIRSNGTAKYVGY